MSDKDPVWWVALIESVMEHKLALFTAISSFFVAVWTGLSDGKGLARSFFGGLICVVITLCFLIGFYATGLHKTWWPLMGVFIAFIGAERIRDAVLAAWDSRKETIIDVGKAITKRTTTKKE